MPNKVRSKTRYSRKRFSNQKRRSKLRKNTRKKSRAHTPVKRRTNTYRRNSHKGGGEFGLAADLMDGVGRQATAGIDVGGLHIPNQLLLLAASYATYRGIDALPALASATRRQWERFKAFFTPDASGVINASEEEVHAAAMRLFGIVDPPAEQDPYPPAPWPNARHQLGDSGNAGVYATGTISATDPDQRRRRSTRARQTMARRTRQTMARNAAEGPDPEAYDPQIVHPHDPRF